MSDPTFIPEADRELLVVYPDPAHAEAARAALVDAGIAPEDIHVGDETDTIASLRGEMREELSRPWIVPRSGVTHPAERSAVMMAGLGMAIAVLAAFPIALVDFGATYWTRWFVVAVVAGLFASTIGMFAGPARLPQSGNEGSAATRGTLLRVNHDSAGLRRVLAELDPIRIDEVTHDGDPIAMVMHQEERQRTE
jgi:hypothetical protein